VRYKPKDPRKVLIRKFDICISMKEGSFPAWVMDDNWTRAEIIEGSF